MHALSVGDEIEISEPKNHFPLVSSADHSILLAGGIGITPILSMARFLLRVGQSFELHYCIRNRSRAAFVDLLSAPELSKLSNVYCDAEPSTGAMQLSKITATPSPGKHIYVCGPGGFIEASLSAAEAAGWKETNVHRESFAASALFHHEPGSFQIRLARSNKTLEVGAGNTVLDVLRTAGVRLPFSCLEGTCGTCLTNVLEGEPDHRDTYLTSKERARNDRFLPCCSRSKTPTLVLDI